MGDEDLVRSSGTDPLPFQSGDLGPSSGEPADLDMAAAALRANSSDVPVLLKVLASQLSDALGDRVVAKRAGGLFKKSDEVKLIETTLGDVVLRAELEGSTLRCSASYFSGGIRIRTEPLGMDEWVARLLKALRDEAGHSDRARQVLENLVIKGGT